MYLHWEVQARNIFSENLPKAWIEPATSHTAAKLANHLATLALKDNSLCLNVQGYDTDIHLYILLHVIDYFF